MKFIITYLILTFCTLSFAQRPADLRCEHLSNPLGMDTPLPRMTWRLDDARFGAIQNAYRIVVGADSVAVAHGQGNIWDTQKVSSDKMLVVYQGQILQPFTKYYWQVRLWDKDNVELSSAVASFETGMMSMDNWKGYWISDGHGLNGHNIDVKPAPYFRKQFDAAKKIRSARAYIAVAGLYELYINGQKIGNHRLDPMFTRFDRRNLYVAYDVTRQLQDGQNAIGVLLGNGWYNHQSTAEWFFHRAPWRDRPTFCMDLHIIYEDGSKEIVVTDKSWKTSLSPIIFNSIYTAEHYDARLEQPGWNTEDFDDSGWRSPIILRAAPSQNIVSQQLHPIRNVECIPTQTVKKMNDTTWIFDLGRNIAGVSEFKIKGEAGTVIRLKHAEILDKDGFPDMNSIELHYLPTDDSDPFQTDIFILGGKGEETFMPRFNYKGFQYVEVTSSKPLQLATDNLTGWFMHSDVPPKGKLETSDPIINKIWWATNNSHLSNLFGYHTDCPQREKNGWTGDSHIIIEMALYNFDSITIYEKWLADHRDEQQPNGTLPAIIPSSGWGYEWANGPDWTSTITIIPWNIYLFYGDDRLLADCYDNIRRFVDRITETAPEGLTSWGLGDWIPVKSKTPVEFTSSVYYYVSATILANAAKMFDKQTDYEKYSVLAQKIRNAINNKYLNRETGIYGQGVQTELSVPLQWNVVPEEMRAKVAANLAKRVEADNKHLDVGLLGSKAILNALSENGYADLAFTIASQRSFPSWGWWMVNGATTLYENWHIESTTELSLSRNHIMFGEVSAWFFKALGGIKPDPAQPGFKNIILRPYFVTGLTYVTVTHQSPYGEIVSKWERKKKDIFYSVTVPANSTADLYLPKGIQVKKITLADGKTSVSLLENLENGYRLPAGSYLFQL
ncbi:MAG: glycoside hydrolase family 78 protein [Bacteroidales bacterium]|nr:glycoside hydrolase family 78 protein [Bacteroidales bacterium]